MNYDTVHGDQMCLVDDYRCTEPGQRHVVRDGWRGFNNDPEYCVRCTRRLWLSPGDGWYAHRRAYRIEEEPAAPRPTTPTNSTASYAATSGSLTTAHGSWGAAPTAKRPSAPTCTRQHPGQLTGTPSKKNPYERTTT